MPCASWLIAMRKNIFAFGEVMMRLQVPGYETLMQSNQLVYSFSGTGVNILSALATFGHQGYLVSKLPDNSLGHAAKCYVQKLGVHTDFIARGGDYLGMYFLENGFGPRPSKVTYSNRLSSAFNTGSIGDYQVDHFAKTADIFHFCGISLAMNESIRDQMFMIAEKVKERGGVICFDCNFRPKLWDSYEQARPHYRKMLSLADIVFMNEKDATFLLEICSDHTEREEQLKDVIPKAARLYQISTIAGTHRTIHQDQVHSLKGFLYTENRFTFSKSHTFPVYDRIGTGDAYVSGIIHGVASAYTPQQTVEFAAAASVLAHTTAGDTPLSTEKDIRSFLELENHDIER